jgi:hypothetical protein
MAKNAPLLIEIGPGLSMIVGLPRIASWKTAKRPKKVRNGAFGYNSQTNCLEFFDGSTWFEAPLSKT